MEFQVSFTLVEKCRTAYVKVRDSSFALKFGGQR